MADVETSDPVVAAQRAIQHEVGRSDRKQSRGDGGAAQLGARDYPAPPFPEQHQAKPGAEARLDPARM